MRKIKLLQTKKIILVQTFVILLLILVTSCKSNSKHSNSDSEIPMPKKVLFILADDIGAEWFGAYGNATQKTPNIDNLANTGVVFDNFSALPLCSPSRQTILIGTHQHHRYKYGWTMPGDTPTFLQILNKQGFKTGVFGKWHGFKHNTSFTEFKVDDYTIFNSERFWNPNTIENGEYKSYKETDFGPDIYNAKLLNFLTKNKDEKFFAYYPMALGHWPFVPTPESVNKNETDWQINFNDMVNYTDKLVGQVINHLEKLGIADETLVIFTADNGTYPELYTKLKNGDTFKGGKSFPVQSGHRVPFIVHYGKHLKQKRLNDVADFKDIFPSLMDMASVDKLPENYGKLDGESLMPLLLKNEPRQKKFSLSYFEAVSSRKDMRALHIRNQDWKLYSDGRLVDLKNDPNEYKFTTGFGETNAQQSARTELQKELDELRKHDDDYRIVEDMLYKENGKTIGCWAPSEISTNETQQIKINFTPFISSKKDYLLEIQHFKGLASVNVSNVKLLKNNVLIWEDNHTSISGYTIKKYKFDIKKQNSLYNINLEKTPELKANYELVFDLKQITEGDSYGYIKLLPAR